MSLPSGLLSPQENQRLKDMLGMGRNGPRQSLSTAVARVYVTTKQSRHKEWMPLVTGVVCFVKDFDRRSYYVTVSRILRATNLSEGELSCRRSVWTKDVKSGSRKFTTK